MSLTWGWGGSGALSGSRAGSRGFPRSPLSQPHGRPCPLLRPPLSLTRPPASKAHPSPGRHLPAACLPSTLSRLPSSPPPLSPPCPLPLLRSSFSVCRPDAYWPDPSDLPAEGSHRYHFPRSTPEGDQALPVEAGAGARAKPLGKRRSRPGGGPWLWPWGLLSDPQPWRSG